MLVNPQVVLIDEKEPVDPESFDFEKISIKKKFGNRTIVNFNSEEANYIKIVGIVQNLFNIKGEPVLYIDRIVFLENGLDWWKKNNHRIRMKFAFIYFGLYVVTMAAMIPIVTYESFDSLLAIVYCLITLSSSLVMGIGVVTVTHDDDVCEFIMKI